jgi:hypothetical protein
MEYDNLLRLDFHAMGIQKMQTNPSPPIVMSDGWLMLAPAEISTVLKAH